MSALATLLWIGCALPSGLLESAGPADDAATPFFREPWVLVPAITLLVLGPVAVALTPSRAGRLMILAATDSFVTVFAALVLAVRPRGWSSLTGGGGVGYALLLALDLLALLSLLETSRLLRGRVGAPGRWLGGARLALCLLVLAVPAQLLLVAGQERALLLAPFLLVALSAGGARLARTRAGLGVAAAGGPRGQAGVLGRGKR
jgi:hypothetical protein